MLIIENSQRTSRAALNALEGHMWSAGRVFETPDLDAAPSLHMCFASRCSLTCMLPGNLVTSFYGSYNKESFYKNMEYR